MNNTLSQQKAAHLKQTAEQQTQQNFILTTAYLFVNPPFFQTLDLVPLEDSVTVQSSERSNRYREQNN